ncbi:MAG: ABC transporter ATP-binding protein/permease [Lachnospiraceae bacterium]|nr:ABC transporter ATP-binding protein/permease [Lachnospiraceae bacterium]
MKKHTVYKVISLVQKLEPGLLPLIIITRLIASATPFITIFFSSRILDLLLSRAEFRIVMNEAFAMIAMSALFNIVRWGLEGIIGVKKQVLSEKVHRMICEKSFEIDYEILEKSETLDMVHRAQEGMNSRGNIGVFCDLLASSIEHICTIIYAAVLLFPLFIPKSSIGLTAAAGFSGTVNLSGIAGILNKWYSFVFLLVSMGGCLWITSFTNRRIARVQQEDFEVNVRNNRLVSCFSDFAYNYRQGKYIRLYKMQNMILGEIKKSLDSVENVDRNTIRKFRKLACLNLSSFLVLQLTSYIYIGLKAICSLISIGSTLRYVQAYQSLAQSLGNIFSMLIQINLTSKYLAYFYDYMEIPNKRYEGTLPVEKRDDGQYEIEFRNVSFHYPNNDTLVLSHINEKLSLRQKTAIVGKNGAGKSTFIKLLCRLYDPTEGEILLNGVDIRYYDYKEYTSLFSIVFQDFNLFSFSIAENVAASADYSEEHIRDCIRRAGFGERLDAMPDGIHTNIYQLEEKGLEISGGEAQKLAIARALYKDAPWVILDEPTSALDPVSEYEIYRHFDELVKNKTALYISHRMSSCRFCDQIYVFDGGNIVQHGSHEELMADGSGLYCQLWNAQAQYYNIG